MNRYLRNRSDYLNNLIEKYNFVSIDQVGELIEEGYAKGEIREDLPKEFVKQIVNYLFYNLQLIVNAENLKEYEDSANNLVDFIKNGIKK